MQRPVNLNMQTAFAAVNTVIPQLSMDKLIALFTTNAKKIFNLPLTTINESQ